MLERLRLTDFKSFLDEEAELSPLTLLVGANASGKSNFLDALRFLQQTTSDMSLAEVLDGEERAGVERWPGIRGGSREAARIGSSVFAVESTWRVPVPEGVGPGDAPLEAKQPDRLELTHRIACSTAPLPKLEAESLALLRQGNDDLIWLQIRGIEACCCARKEFQRTCGITAFGNGSISAVSAQNPYYCLTQ